MSAIFRRAGTSMGRNSARNPNFNIFLSPFRDVFISTGAFSRTFARQGVKKSD